MRKTIQKFLKQFPDNATCWSQATDEVRDIARWSREILEEKDGVIIAPLDFPSFTPSEWNTHGKQYVLSNFDRMKPETQREFFKMFHENLLEQ